MKKLSATLILFIGLNLAATGLALGLCTGQAGCAHCALNAPAHSKTMAMPGMPGGHGCCKTPTAAPCDVEKNSIPQRAFTHLPPLKQTLKRFISIDTAAQGILEAGDLNPTARTVPHPAKIPHQKEPLYIRHLTLIC